jgi:catechol 2,3-dioxygenase-like lactoylglutathione lyase family enzyme
MGADVVQGEHAQPGRVNDKGLPHVRAQNESKKKRAMSTNEVPSLTMNLEIHIVPVSDVDRAKEFYQQLGWRLDDDVAPMDGLRIVQFTPLGSATSITFGLGLTTAAPGSTQGALIISDIEAAHDGLLKLGIDMSDMWHGPPFPVEARQPGPAPSAPATGRSAPSRTRKAICGSCRRSPRGSRAGSTPQKRHSRRQKTCRTRGGGRPCRAPEAHRALAPLSPVER